MQNSKHAPRLYNLLKQFRHRYQPSDLLFLIVLLGLASIGIWSHWFGLGIDEKIAVQELVDYSPPSIEKFVDVFSFPSKLEQYVSNEFPVRLEATRLNNLARITLLNQKVFSQVLVGKGGWLYYTSERNIEDFQRTNLLSAQEIDQIQNTFNRWGEFSKEQGIPFVVLIAPNKETVYPEFLPDFVQSLESPSRLDQILGSIEIPNNIQMVDPRSQLWQAKQAGLVYFKTDTHWNITGECVAYSMLITAIKNNLPNINPFKCEDVHRTTEVFSGDLSKLLAMRGLINEENEFGRILFQDAKFTNVVTDRWIASEISGSTLPRIMAFRDSFLTGMMPLISENFSRVDYFWTYKIDYERIIREQPDLVIFEFVERNAQLALSNSQ